MTEFVVSIRERNDLEVGVAFLRDRAQRSNQEVIAFIDGHRRRFGVEPIGSVLYFAPSTYFAEKARPLSARAVREGELRPAIEQVHRENFRVHGVDKAWAALNREGTRVDRCARASDLDPLPGRPEAPAARASFRPLR